MPAQALSEVHLIKTGLPWEALFDDALESIRLTLRLAKAEQLPMQRRCQVGIQALGHGLGAAEPDGGPLPRPECGQIQPTALGFQVQPVVDPGPAAQLGQMGVIGGGLGRGGALQQGGAGALLTTAHQGLQPGDEGGDANAGAHPEGGGRVWQGEGAIGACHSDRIPHLEVLV